VSLIVTLNSLSMPQPPVVVFVVALVSLGMLVSVVTLTMSVWLSL